MKLNCDLGEFKDNNDAMIMPLIDRANIACGFHGSDTLTIANTVKLAHQHKVIIGAHPSYPDVENFGRVSMSLPPNELSACLHYQIGALQALCIAENTQLRYVKPHGALYNDMMKSPDIFRQICQVVATINSQQETKKPLALMIQALADTSQFDNVAAQFDLTLWYEAFADRAYQDNGLLVPRSETGAVIKDTDQIIKRCENILNNQGLTSINNESLPLTIDTLCVHGDTPNALAMLKALRNTINQHQC
jgi:UPF0271 protein